MPYAHLDLWMPNEEGGGPPPAEQTWGEGAPPAEQNSGGGAPTSPQRNILILAGGCRPPRPSLGGRGPQSPNSPY